MVPSLCSVTIAPGLQVSKYLTSLVNYYLVQCMCAHDYTFLDLKKKKKFSSMCRAIFYIFLSFSMHGCGMCVRSNLQIIYLCSKPVSILNGKGSSNWLICIGAVLFLWGGGGGGGFKRETRPSKNYKQQQLVVTTLELHRFCTFYSRD